VAIETVSLSPALGVAITGVTEVGDLLDNAVISRCLEALKWRGVLVIRGVHLDDEGQLAFTRMLGNVFAPAGERIWHVGFGPAELPALRNLESNFQWHIDGYTPDIPAKFTVLTARRVPAAGGGTEFADTYAAYASLPQYERKRFEGLRVVHTFEAVQRPVVAQPSEQQLAHWRSMPTHESWLVWKRRDGRRSLVICTSADHIVGMDADESRALLDDLVLWATQERFCYAHTWQVGDLVVWDNTGLLHRALPYDVSSGRTLHRTAIEGDEAWS
jgi:alpha-ketoglutarate-dependent taurine dioxygenase